MGRMNRFARLPSAVRTRRHVVSGCWLPQVGGSCRARPLVLGGPAPATRCCHAAMVKRYAHVTARLRRDIADRLNTFLWASNETGNADLPLFRIKDDSPGLAMMVSRPAQDAAADRDGPRYTNMYETRNETRNPVRTWCPSRSSPLLESAPRLPALGSAWVLPAD